MEQTNAAYKFIVWISFILAIIGITLAWVAYNRSGRDLEDVAQAQLNEFQQTAEIQYAVISARLRLLALRSLLVTQENTEAIAADVQIIREDLAQAYNNASLELQTDWQEIDQNLGNLETAIRNNSVDALERLDIAIEDLQQEIRTDENSNQQTIQ